jgi:hypothetical protein
MRGSSLTIHAGAFMVPWQLQLELAARPAAQTLWPALSRG